MLSGVTLFLNAVAVRCMVAAMAMLRAYIVMNCDELNGGYTKMIKMRDCKESGEKRNKISMSRTASCHAVSISRCSNIHTLESCDNMRQIRMIMHDR